MTKKAVRIFGLDFYTPNVRIEQIHHNIAVVDTVIFFVNNKDFGINKNNILSEREIKHKNGFGNPKHEPDFIFTQDGESFCIEVELSPKSKTRLEKNISGNFSMYDGQIWVVPEKQVKINEILKGNENKYPNIEIIPLESVREYVK